MFTKGCVGFFLVCLELELFAKIKKRPGFYTFTEIWFINNSRSKQTKKKNPEHHFVDIGKKETCAQFLQKILNSIVVGARQFSIFQTNNLVSQKYKSLV